MKPTPEQIKSEIEWLKQNKSKIPRRTVFGDDNHAAIDAQIRALEEDMDEDEAYRLEEEGEWSDRERENAVDAILWRDGEEEHAPSHDDCWGGVLARAQKK